MASNLTPCKSFTLSLLIGIYFSVHLNDHKTFNNGRLFFYHYVCRYVIESIGNINKYKKVDFKVSLGPLSMRTTSHVYLSNILTVVIDPNMCAFCDACVFLES